MTHALARLAWFAGAVLLAAPMLPAAAPPRAKARRANRLARESSPYLLQHAHNPVDWQPWGPEAFAKAKKEGKLVFLSVGYSSCHWCHVMEKESFADAEVAKLLNANFVCIKVDREERPDIDDVYMTAHQVIREGSGGWPLSVFLTAAGKPIFAGTYWPREDREVDGVRVRGFKTVCRLILEVRKEHPKELLKRADDNAKKTAAWLASRGLGLVPLDRKLVEGVAETLREEFDPVHGGFGSAARGFRGSKFPMPPRLLFLEGEVRRAKSKPAAEMLAVTLDRMARGGIYDHLGGGFHRYSTERTWSVPHFEKMLYDSAQLLEVYAAAYKREKKPPYARMLRQTMGFVAREMTAPEGGFYSALDADSAGEEGRFYVWTPRELDAVFTDKEQANLFKKAYGADSAPNFEGKYYILRLPAPPGLAASRKMTEAELERRLPGLRGKLLAARAKRPRPFLDTKVLTAWNGEMIAGLARAGHALGDKRGLAAAARAADFVLRKLRTREGRLLRSYAAAPGRPARARFNAYLDDYAFFVHGLLCLHDATGEKRWLDEAKALTETMVKHHADEARGGFFLTSHDHEKLFARAKPQYDGAQPSGNSVAASNLVRLWVKTGDVRYDKLAAKTFRAFAGILTAAPDSLPGLADALGAYLEAKARKE
jgi:uncharacterized protein YyaL (SSP411 family)